MSTVILKPGKEKAIKNRHHWIFSGAVAHFPSCVPGEILSVQSHEGELLGAAYFNPKSNIIGRMIAFDSIDALQQLEENLAKSLALRKSLFDHSTTNGYRLVHGEGDGLPGLIVDRYADCLVIQISTLGMERLKKFVLAWLLTHVENISVIYEKSESGSRKEEGLMPLVGHLFGTDTQPVEIRENGIKFLVDFYKGQKSGFFCDQRLVRKKVQQLSEGKSVLNCFAYSGGFTLYALQGGALRVDSVEISEEALKMLRTNVELNGFSDQRAHYFQEDVFSFLRNASLDYQLVILDPPAFAKKQKDLVAACRGYKEINRLALKKMPPGSLLLTCSCSYFIDAALFQKVIFQASVEAGRNVRIIGRHLLAEDHPINICHPENDYLKSLLLYVE